MEVWVCEVCESGGVEVMYGENGGRCMWVCKVRV